MSDAMTMPRHVGHRHSARKARACDRQNPLLRNSGDLRLAGSALPHLSLGEPRVAEPTQLALSCPGRRRPGWLRLSLDSRRRRITHLSLGWLTRRSPPSPVAGLARVARLPRALLGYRSVLGYPARRRATQPVAGPAVSRWPARASVAGCRIRRGGPWAAATPQGRRRNWWRGPAAGQPTTAAACSRL